MSTENASAISEEYIETFVGKNIEFYRPKWQKIAEKNNNPMSWNLAAFFLGMFWMLYRKMYKYTFIFAALLALDIAIEWFYPLPESMGNVFNLIIAIMFGFYGNVLYQHHVNTKVNEVLATYPPEQVEAELKRQGGVSMVTAIGVFLLFVAFIFAVVFTFPA